MPDESEVGSFVSASPYTAQADIKKLRFILAALDRYVACYQTGFANLQVLEVACGRGGIALPIASLGCQVTAFDIDVEDVQHLQAQVAQRGADNLSVTIDNGYTFDDGRTYDVVVASEVFEHVLEPSRLAENITRRMGEGSFLVVTTPNGYGPWELVGRMNVRAYLSRRNSLRRMLGKTPYVEGNGRDHCQFYTRGRLLRLFSEHCLGLVDSGKSDSFLAILPSLRRNTVLGRLDTKLADILPYWLASGWYFVFQLRRTGEPA